MRIVTDVHDHASLVDASVCNVWPAWIATKDGGATPGKEKLRIGIMQLLVYHLNIVLRTQVEIFKMNFVLGLSKNGKLSKFFIFTKQTMYV